jgi:hypothetical protein
VRRARLVALRALPPGDRGLLLDGLPARRVAAPQGGLRGRLSRGRRPASTSAAAAADDDDDDDNNSNDNSGGV